MNNFTTAAAAPKEPLPRTGHVNEVCKEWLVREDGALAYKLQSQEINDFYKGNRYRNAVVREDFPTALHEQIKETENAQRQVEAYRRRLTAQEEHDKRVAKEIADKLERDLQEQQQKELQQSEKIAQQMQEIYVNLPPVPPPATRDKGRAPPPRPAKASIHQHQQNHHHLQHQHNNNQHHNHNQQQQQQFNGSRHASTSAQARYYSQHQQQQVPQPLQLQQQHFSQTDNYVGLSLVPNIVDIPKAASTVTATSTGSPTRQSNNQLLVSDGDQQQQQQSSRIHHHQQPQITSAAAAVTRRHVLYEPQSPSPSHSSLNTVAPDHLNSLTHTQHTQHNTTSNTSNAQLIDELVDYADVADSIRGYDMSAATAAAPPTTPLKQQRSSPPTIDGHDAPSSSIHKQRSPSHDNLLRAEPKFQKLSPEKYDQLVGNFGVGSAKAAERHMQQHADDIELYVDPCDYASLREIGLPMEEIKELKTRLKQEQKDELLARRLQAIESKDSVRQEERDRMLAIEAQDKELAKMLQEREKAKVKRAKEKARLRKNQQKEASSSTTLCGVNTHCGPLLPLPQDCMSKSQESAIDVEAYSNPIDVLHSQQHQQQQQQQQQQHRLQNGTLTNGSLTRDSSSSHGSMQRHQQRHQQQHNGTSSRDDDIYTLPVDSCRPDQRPVSLHMAAETVVQQQLQTHNNSMTRSEQYGSDGSHDGTLSSHDISPHMKYSKSGGNFDQNASPTPPYMPIQGTRRSNSSEDRKKKSKDNKCTHQ